MFDKQKNLEELNYFLANWRDELSIRHMEQHRNDHTVSHTVDVGATVDGQTIWTQQTAGVRFIETLREPTIVEIEALKLHAGQSTFSVEDFAFKAFGDEKKHAALKIEGESKSGKQLLITLHSGHPVLNQYREALGITE